MQTNKEAEQVTLSDLGICGGKMFQEPSPAELPKARTSVSSSKRSSELSAVPFMSLGLTPGHGNLLGESYWELISPWLCGAWMLNTGVSPSDVKGSSLSQILQADPPTKYYLTPKACLGILRRASERGKELPKKLARALKIQAGLMRPDGQPTGLDAYHINQRDEGIDLHGVSGALMATTNMQMQTFVTQPDEAVEGFDGYNGDLTGDVAATLGVNCGMSTGRNGVMAFAANQVVALNGGSVVAQDGAVTGEVPLAVAGIMSDEPLVEVNRKLEEAKEKAFAAGVNRNIDPFMTLSFMALPVTPTLRITTRGVFDVTTQRYI